MGLVGSRGEVLRCAQDDKGGGDPAGGRVRRATVQHTQQHIGMPFIIM
jgi:hypothetical protein